MGQRYTYEPLPKLEFEKKRSRVKTCPCGKCNKDGKFAPYKGYYDKGFCHSCGKTFLPEVEKWQQPAHLAQQPKPKTQPNPPISFVPFGVFEKSLQKHTENNFVKFLFELFNKHGEGELITTSLIEKYYIGTSKHWNGAIVFWQISIQGKIRAGKIMLYCPATGKRIKKPYDYITWGKRYEYK